jgi:hypothetical protein
VGGSFEGIYHQAHVVAFKLVFVEFGGYTDAKGIIIERNRDYRFEPGVEAYGGDFFFSKVESLAPYRI